MKKTYIFKTKNNKEDLTLRGGEGLKKMEKMEYHKMTDKIMYGGIITTIHTKFETLDELKEALGV